MKVVHKTYGWKGTVAQYGHTDGQVMVIWDHGGRVLGASLVDLELVGVGQGHQGTLGLEEG